MLRSRWAPPEMETGGGQGLERKGALDYFIHPHLILVSHF